MNFNFSLEAPKLSELKQKDIDDMWELCRELKEKLNANPQNSWL
jgi:ribosomal protein L29